MCLTYILCRKSLVFIIKCCRLSPILKLQHTSISVHTFVLNMDCVVTYHAHRPTSSNNIFIVLKEIYTFGRSVSNQPYSVWLYTSFSIVESSHSTKEIKIFEPRETLMFSVFCILKHMSSLSNVLCFVTYVCTNPKVFHLYFYPIVKWVKVHYTLFHLQYIPLNVFNKWSSSQGDRTLYRAASDFLCPAAWGSWLDCDWHTLYTCWQSVLIFSMYTLMHSYVKNSCSTAHTVKVSVTPAVNV